MSMIAAVILAAGKGTRMKSNTPKVLHPVAGRPMLFYPIEALRELKAKKVVVVVGHGAALVREAFKGRGVSFVTQAEQLGTGHAVMCAMKELKGFSGDVLILSGDVPLVSRQTISALMKVHAGRGKNRPVLSLVTALLEDPSGYGRVVRDDNGAVVRIVEDKDCSPLQKGINEINTGLYLVSSGFLLSNIKKLGKENAQGEYYLPDLIEMAASQGNRVGALTHLEPNEVMGINNRVELARANSLMRARINERLMSEGVSIIDPGRAYIDFSVSAGADTVIYPGVSLAGETRIGEGCTIEEGAVIRDSIVKSGAVVKSYSVIEGSTIEEGASVGPFARLRPGTVVKKGARVGNFVEVKKSSIGAGSKANHLSYIGDSVVGADVNIGAGTITCNYDGFKKSLTVIEDGAFIGSDSQLVAPVRVGKGAYVGSGTTVTRDVPPGSLVITRAKERVIEGWAAKRRKKGGKDKKDSGV